MRQHHYREHVVEISTSLCLGSKTYLYFRYMLSSLLSYASELLVIRLHMLDIVYQPYHFCKTLYMKNACIRCLHGIINVLLLCYKKKLGVHIGIALFLNTY